MPAAFEAVSTFRKPTRQLGTPAPRITTGKMKKSCLIILHIVLLSNFVGLLSCQLGFEAVVCVGGLLC